MEVNPRITDRKLTVLALLCAVFLAAMEATAVATVMPTIVGDLGGLNHYSWVFTAYMMASTISVPIYGKLSDVYGRKPILQAGIGLFLVGSLSSALATSMTQLIIFRALQGLGAGAIQPMGLTITGDIFKIEERAKITAIFGTVWGVAGITGPLIGSLIVSTFGWPWLFYINIPFGIASASILHFALQENVEKKDITLDWLGALLLSGSIASTLFAVNDPENMVLMVPLSTLLFLSFLLVEQRAKDPIFPLEFFSNPIISNACLVNIMIGGAMLSFVTYLPLYVESVRQMGIMWAGLSIIPMGIGWPLASGLSARIIPKHGFQNLLRMGLCFVVMGCLTTTLTAFFNLSFFFLMVGMGVLGLGMGFSSIPLLFSVQASVDWNRRGSATASTLFFRTMGGTISVGVMGAILAQALLKDPSLPPSVANDLIGPNHGAGISDELLAKLADVMDWGLDRIFFASTSIAAIALLFGMYFPEVNSKETTNESL